MAEEKEKKPKVSFKEASRVFRYLKPYSGIFSLGFVFLILSSLTAMLFPYFIGQLIGNDGTEGAVGQMLNFDGLEDIILALAVVFTSQAIFSFFRILLFTRVTEYTLADIRRDAFSKLIMSPLEFFNRNKIGELTSRIATDISKLQTTFTTTIAEFVRQVITIVVGIAALVWLSPKLSLIMLSVIPAVALIAVFFGRFIRKLSKQTQDASAQSNSILEEALQGIQNVKAFTNEAFEMRRYGVRVDEIRALAMKGAIWRGLFVSFIILCLFGSIVFVIWQGVLLTQEGNMLQSSFISFIMYTIFLGASIGSLPDLYAGIQKAVGATENLMDIIDGDSENIQHKKTDLRSKTKGDIEFKDVNFSYASRENLPVLKGINFEVKTGELLGIVGPSGAGKSTITSLLLRFYEPTSGGILLDGKAASDYDLSTYRSLFGIVPQEVILFNGTIKENIGYGNPEASEEEIITAAEKANAMEFISNFPEGMETLVGERGVQLSGGQRQRIAIARAVLRDPCVLILDEATSSLDSKSEKLVQDALEELMKGRTAIVIAHRLSTIRNASKIIVVEDGEIVESGSHADLMANNDGLYTKLQQMQQVNLID
ncbi:ABC transporter transmembrane domain-containing protein [Cryomorphaceae bacterium 1068]|nr:ABC transporter transmembrane domain-containing protein [Cryomorphaceae bacterium 1068]